MENSAHWQKVLLVDDDTILNLIHKKLLGIVGYHGTVLEFKNGLEALEFINLELVPVPLSDKVINLIILDLEMPILDGWGFLDRFQLLDPKVTAMFKIIVSSSSMNPKNINRALAYNSVDEYISKPLTIEDFRRLIGVCNNATGESDLVG